MSPGEKSDVLLVELQAALEADIAAARARVAECVAELLDVADAPPRRATLAFVAVCVDRAYSAVEAAFLRIAREVDERTPTGDSWHAALVHQMSLPIADRRPSVIDDALALSLDPLRRHRHWLRHAYATTFEWSRMREVVAEFPATIEAACGALSVFARSLDARSS